MIIECKNCKKKFNVDSNLIPKEGRLIQCGSCNHAWHYKTEVVTSEPHILDNDETAPVKNLDNNETAPVKNLDNDETAPVKNLDNNQIISNKEIVEDVKDLTILNQNINANKNTNIKKNDSKIVSIFFSYLLVFVISFISLIILIDTLKSPLINIFPQLEIFLFNLFETLKDVKLFIIDLT